MNVALASLSVLRSLPPAALAPPPPKRPAVSPGLGAARVPRALASAGGAPRFAGHLSAAVRVASDFAYRFLEVNQNHLALVQGKIHIEHCVLLLCTADVGGAIYSEGCGVQIRFTTLRLNHARIAGACYHIRSESVAYCGNALFANRADYDGAGMCDAAEGVATTLLNATNCSLNAARLWSGGWRIDAVGGALSRCVFDSNAAAVNGAFFDFSWTPAHRHVLHCLFANNSAQARGGAFCAFHLQHSSRFERVVFIANRCEHGPRSIAVESIDTIVWMTEVYFDGPESEELGMRFGESEFVKLAGVQFEVRQQEIIQRASIARAQHQVAQQPW